MVGRCGGVDKNDWDTTETVKFNVASENLHRATCKGNAHTIIAVVNGALSQARRDVQTFQGALIEAGRSVSTLSRQSEKFCA